MKYKIVEKRSPGELTEAVQKLLDEGWYLHGTLVVVPGVASDHYRCSESYCQVLTKGEDDL